METLNFIGHFVERYGLGLFVVVWFMFRNEKHMQRLSNKLNRLIITNVMISRTLDLDAEEERMIDAAASDDDDSPLGGLKP